MIIYLYKEKVLGSLNLNIDYLCLVLLINEYFIEGDKKKNKVIV